MKEKIYEEFNRPDYIQVEEEYLQRLKDDNEILKDALEDIKIALEIDDIEEVKEIVRGVDERLN